jgi:hypothetical protein
MHSRAGLGKRAGGRIKAAGLKLADPERRIKQRSIPIFSKTERSLPCVGQLA